MAEYIPEDLTVHKNNGDQNHSYGNEAVTVLPKPQVTVKKEDHGIVVKVGNFQADAIRIFSKRSTEDKFVLLAQVPSAQYTDTRPNLFGAPELREYIVQFIRNERQVGETSDIILIIKK